MNKLEDRFVKLLPEKFWYRALLLVVISLVICAVGFYVVFQLETTRLKNDIQHTLDQQCGFGEFSIEGGDFSYDPMTIWHGYNASCYVLDGKVTCNCPE